LALSLDYRFDYQGNSHDFNEAIYLYEAAPLLSDFSEISISIENIFAEGFHTW
jgi:hypothetical protein